MNGKRAWRRRRKFYGGGQSDGNTMPRQKRYRDWREVGGGDWRERASERMTKSTSTRDICVGKHLSAQVRARESLRLEGRAASLQDACVLT